MASSEETQWAVFSSDYSHLLLFGATLNFDKLLGIPGGSLMISGAEATGKNLSDYVGNINAVSEAFSWDNKCFGGVLRTLTRISAYGVA